MYRTSPTAGSILRSALAAGLLMSPAVSAQLINNAPVANPDTYTTKVNAVLNVAAPGVLGNDTDLEGQPLTARLATGPLNGTAIVNSNGSFTYTPRADYAGADSFSYFANDGVADSVLPTTVTITVENDPPLAADDSYNMNEDTTLTVPAASGVLANDRDPNGTRLAVAGGVALSGPTHGSLLLNPDGSFSYTPAVDFNGSDSFTYKTSDGLLDSLTGATVTITISNVQEPPAAVNDSYSVNEDSTLNIPAPGILQNDTDPEANPLSVASPRPISGPSRGTLTLNADGSFIYTPGANYNGTDSFTYKANDGTVDSLKEATVALTIAPVNDAPVAADDSYAADQGAMLTVLAEQGILKNDSDVDGNTLKVSGPAAISGPSHGTLTLNSDGSFAYTPSPDFVGTDNFAYKANDGTADSAAATVSINVAAGNPTELLRLDAGVPLAVTLDNPCTTGHTEAIAFKGTMLLHQEVWKQPNGNLRLIISESMAMQGHDTAVFASALYAFAGRGEIDVEFAFGAASLMIYKKVLHEWADDNFHVVLVLTLNPSTLKLDVKLEAACDNGQP